MVRGEIFPFFMWAMPFESRDKAINVLIVTETARKRVYVKIVRHLATLIMESLLGNPT